MTLRLPTLALVLLLTAAVPDVAPPLQTLQLVETATPEGEQKVLPGTVVAKAALARPEAAILAHEIALGPKRTLLRGTVVRAEAETGIAGVSVPVFCEPPRARPAGTLPPVPVASGAARQPPPDPRACLFDANADHKFDHAFLIDAAGKARAPFVVAATDFGRIDGRPLGATSVAHLRYLGPVQATGDLAFELEAYVHGWKSAVPQPRTVVSIARLPAYGLVGTAVVTVLAYDKQTRIATIRMDHGLAPGHIVVPELNRGY